MKKIYLLCCLLSLSACTSSPQPPMETPVPGEVRQDTDEALILQEVADDFMSELEAFKPQIEDMMDVNVSVRDGGLVYTCQYLVDMGDPTDFAGDLAEEAASQEEMFQSYIQALKLRGLQNPRFIVEYLDMDGNIIYEQTFQ